jgi:hypothetical protein
MTTAQKDKARSARALLGAAREIERVGTTARVSLERIVTRAFVSGVEFLPATERQETLKSFLSGLNEAIKAVGMPGDQVLVSPRVNDQQVFDAPLSQKVGKRRAAETAASDRGTAAAAVAPTDKVRDKIFSEAYAARKVLADKGELLSATKLAERLQVSRQAVNQRVGTGSLFFLGGPNGTTYFPAFFADEKYDKRALRKVVLALEGQSGANKWLFFTSPRLSLAGLTPLDILSGKQPVARAGLGSAERRERVGLDAVLKAASAFAAE